MTNLKRQSKNFLLTTIILLLSNNFYAQNKNNTINYDKLIKAIGVVESGSNDKMKKGVHAGFLSISQVCVKECNRINKMRGKKTRFTLQDRFDRQKSIEMFYTLQSFYNKNLDPHYAVLLWNEGCSAMKKPKRKTKYYLKVMKVYNKLTENNI